MKKSTLAVLGVSVCLAAGTLIAGARDLDAAGNDGPQGTVQQSIVIGDITLDRYCDGLHLEVNLDTGLVTGRTTGCVSTSLGGMFGRVDPRGRGVTIIYNNQFEGFSVIRVNRTWTHYNRDGSFLNSGTWSPGVPQVVGERISFNVDPE